MTGGARSKKISGERRKPCKAPSRGNGYMLLPLATPDSPTTSSEISPITERTIECDWPTESCRESVPQKLSSPSVFGREETPSGNGINKVRIGEAQNVYIGSSNSPEHERGGKSCGEACCIPCGKCVKYLKEKKDQEIDIGTIRGSFVQKLRLRYGTEEAYVSTILGSGKMHQLSLKDYFVDLQLEDRDLEGRVSLRRVERLNEIFHKERSFQRILITGDTGYGKTTLGRKFCYDWATLPSPNYISHFHIVVNIPLRRACSSIERAIEDEIFSGVEEETQMGNIFKGQRILVILDGFDEIINVDNAISFLSNPPLASEGFSDDLTVLVTSRPRAMQDHHSLFHQRLSITGFSAEAQKQYVNKVLPVCEKANILIERIEKERFLEKASECPLLLHLICCVHEINDKVVVSSRIELFLEIFKLLICRFAERNGGNSICGSLAEKDITEDEFFIRLGEVAFRQIAFHKEYHSEEELGLLFPKKEEMDFLLGLGIFVSNTRDSTIGKVVIGYEFIHVIFAEFLASIYISYRLRMSKWNSSHVEFSLEMVKDATLLFTLSLLDKDIKKDTKKVKSIMHQLADNRNLSELLQIRKEKCLSEESWNFFASLARTVRYNYCSEDIGFLSTSIELPKVQTVKIIAEDSGRRLVESIEQLLRKLKTCKSLIIIIINTDITFYHILCRPYGIRFISMEGLVSMVIAVNRMLSLTTTPRIRVFLFHRKYTPKQIQEKEIPCGSTHNTENEKTTEFLESDEFIQVLPENYTSTRLRFLRLLPCVNCQCFREILSRNVHVVSIPTYNPKREDPIGLLPTNIAVPNCHPCPSGQFFKWRIFRSITIFYVPRIQDMKAVPIMLITPAEYCTIAKKEIFAKSHLTVYGFKKIMLDNVNDFPVLQNFGMVSSGQFLDRLQKTLKSANISLSSDFNGEDLLKSSKYTATEFYEMFFNKIPLKNYYVINTSALTSVTVNKRQLYWDERVNRVNATLKKRSTEVNRGQLPLSSISCPEFKRIQEREKL